MEADLYTLVGLTTNPEYTEQVGNIRERRGIRLHADFMGSDRFRKASVRAINNIHEGRAMVDFHSIILFNAAAANVAFVGLYVVSEDKAYLHPLYRTWIDDDKDRTPYTYNNNTDFDWNSAVMQQHIPHLPEHIRRESILHVVGDASSHAQIAHMYGFTDTDFVNQYLIGFSIVKRAGEPHQFNAQSQTMNTTRFDYRERNKIPRSAHQGKDAYITQEWSTALMTLLSRYLV